MRQSDPGKHGKTGKAREKALRKVAIWNTFEQYAGLKLVAASRFFDISSKKYQKSQNRTFLGFEQYAGLESCPGGFPAGSGGQE